MFWLAFVIAIGATAVALLGILLAASLFLSVEIVQILAVFTALLSIAVIGLYPIYLASVVSEEVQCLKRTLKLSIVRSIVTASILFVLSGIVFTIASIAPGIILAVLVLILTFVVVLLLTQIVISCFLYIEE